MSGIGDTLASNKAGLDCVGTGSMNSNTGGLNNGKFLLHLDIQRSKGLANTQFLVAQDPYVKIVLPDGTSERTKCVSGGGTDPEWNTSHGKHITLELNRHLFPCDIIIQVWNENDGYLESDDIIGSAQVALQSLLQMTAEQLQEGTRTQINAMQNS
jgi:Ca2+-dependent lipid-binding protein